MDTANTLESNKSSLDPENELDPNILTPEEKENALIDEGVWHSLLA